MEKTSKKLTQNAYINSIAYFRPECPLLVGPERWEPIMNSLGFPSGAWIRTSIFYELSKDYDFDACEKAKKEYNEKKKERL